MRPLPRRTKSDDIGGSAFKIFAAYYDVVSKQNLRGFTSSMEFPLNQPPLMISRTLVIFCVGSHSNCRKKDSIAWYRLVIYAGIVRSLRRGTRWKAQRSRWLPGEAKQGLPEVAYARLILDRNILA